MLLVKLGGSAITEKTKPMTFKNGKVREVARVMLGESAIVLHGGGSFAHYVAEKYYGSGEWEPRGIALTKTAVLRISSLVVEELADGGASPIPIQPSDIYIGRTLYNRAPIDIALSRGLTPVLYGDVVPSPSGYVIISADDIAVDMARLYRPRVAVFLMDVDGVYTAPPGTPGARKMDVLDVDRLSAAKTGFDVTGGIMKKVQAALAIAAVGIPVYLCSIDDVKSLVAVLRDGHDHDCTYVPPHS